MTQDGVDYVDFALSPRDKSNRNLAYSVINQPNREICKNEDVFQQFTNLYVYFIEIIHQLDPIHKYGSWGDYCTGEIIFLADYFNELQYSVYRQGEVDYVFCIHMYYYDLRILEKIILYLLHYEFYPHVHLKFINFYAHMCNTLCQLT